MSELKQYSKTLKGLDLTECDAIECILDKMDELGLVNCQNVDGCCAIAYSIYYEN